MQEIAWNDEPHARRSSLDFPVVGIGASAGGMAAALRLFGELPDKPGMAFVIVLHLSPEHESHAAAILQRATRMPVVQVTETTPIRIDHVYVIAPALNLAMEDGRLTVGPHARQGGRPVAVDLFFRTLAEAHMERAMAIILSGTGSDGSLGLAEIKAQGGVSFAQEPGEAEFSSMPLAAIATGRVDFVLPATRIPDKLIELWKNAREIELPGARSAGLQSRELHDEAAARAEAALDEVVAMLASRTGNDFKSYKRGTVLRRLERRMQVTRQQNLAAYRDYLESHPQETTELLQDMLISVTSFFRDPESFAALGRQLKSELFKGLAAEAPPLRAWVVGCASGEEAYSLSMLLNECAPEGMPRSSIQIFASDIDERALNLARSGINAEAIAADVSESRLRQFFLHEGGAFRIKKSMREQILFARHNILRDPPFSRLDLICCRNLLIYLERDLQAEVLEMLHFALNPGGLLFLGSAESADFTSEHFTAVDKRHRIYRANPARLPRNEFVLLRGARRLGMADRPTSPVPSLAQLHQRLLDDAELATVLIDGHQAMLHSSAGASRYLRHVTGVPSRDLLSAVLPELASELRPAILLASQSGRRVAARPVRIDGEQGRIVVQMTVRAASRAESNDHMLVVFDEVDTLLHSSPDADSDETQTNYRVLEEGYLRLQRELQGSLGESVSSSEALRASNEELQSMNEELRSATEELETSKEELQSVNEELTTVNFELEHKVEETAKVNDDLSNLITSMNIATLFVDRRMHIKGFTPLSAQVFNILIGDIGRPLGDITHRLVYAGSFASDVAQMLTTLHPVEQEVESVDGRWYLMRISAYRTNEDRIDGAVLNFIDVTDRRAAQEQLRARDERLRLVAESSRDFAVITLDHDGCVTGWNKGAELMFGYDANEVAGTHFRRLFVPEDRGAGAPEHELQTALEQGRALDERWHLRKDGSRFYCSGITTPLVEGSTHGFAKIARDLTERQLLERQREDLLEAEKKVRIQLQDANELRNEFLAVMSHELKNPLNLIMMSSELIGRAPEVQALPRLARAVDTIRRTVHAQSQIIDDLLDLSRLQTGKLTLSRSAVNWRLIVERITDALQKDAEAKQLQLSVQAEDLSIFADVVRVEQIFWNLVSNAVKFTPAGGSIQVRLTRDGHWALLEVADNGRGIAPDFLPHVFDMFQQENHRVATRSEGGLGIGLALVKSLAEMHGGYARASSAGIGAGAAFQVRLPLLEGRLGGETAGEPTDARNVFSGLRILLVDDEVQTLETLGELLSSEGAVVTTSTSAHSALEEVAAADFDLVISDIGMPDMDGLALMARLRSLPQSAGWPAIALTGFGRPSDLEKSAAAGFNLHLNKPVSLETLSEAVEQLRGS